MILQKVEDNQLYNPSDLERFSNEGTIKRTSKRDDYERDYGRIIHSSAFRRLQGKTQVFGPLEGDFHRTRLTHTLEVSQIARGISIQLNANAIELKTSGCLIDVSLVEAAALAHDLGHPPFGHQGERVLNECMKDYGGFEGNAHTFRLLTKLEGNKGRGLNLTRATLLGIIKYPIVFSETEIKCKEKSENPPKVNIFDEDRQVWEWLLKDFTERDINYYLAKEEGDKYYKTKHKTLECSIIELADDIAYATHDLQDVLKFKLLDLTTFIEEALEYINKHNSLQLESIKEILENLNESKQIDTFIPDLIHRFIKNISIVKNDADSMRLKYNAVMGPEVKGFLDLISKVVYNKVIKGQRVQTLEWKGNIIIKGLFDAMMDSDLLLPEDKRFEKNDDTKMKARKVCDYIAGMTDQYAANFYKRLYEPGTGRLFDI